MPLAVLLLLIEGMQQGKTSSHSCENTWVGTGMLEAEAEQVRDRECVTEAVPAQF